MTFYINSRLTEALNKSTEDPGKYKITASGLPFGLQKVQLKQSELAESNARQAKRSAELKILLSLYHTYLESLPQDQQVKKLISALQDKTISEYEPNNELIQNLQKGYLKWLKAHSKSLEAVAPAHPSNLLYFRLMNLKLIHLKQLETINSQFKQVSKISTQIRSEMTKDAQLSDKRVSIYDSLLRNLELRMDHLNSRTTSRGMGNEENEGMEQYLEELREKEEDIKRLIANNGWGYIHKIKEKVNLIKQLKEQL